MSTSINENIHRKEAWDKVSGNAKYTADKPVTGYLHARLLTSPHSHARIKSIDCLKASQLQGVKSIITGNDFPVLKRSPAGRQASHCKGCGKVCRGTCCRCHRCHRGHCAESCQND